MNVQIIEVIEDKNSLLQQHVKPNVIYNRFDVRFKNFDLYIVEYANTTMYIPVAIEGKICYLGMFLRSIPKEILEAFMQYVSNKYCRIERICIEYCKTPLRMESPVCSWYILFPETEQEYMNMLSYKMRFNIRRSLRILEKKYPKEYNVEHFTKEDITEEIVSSYFTYKQKTHNVDFIYSKWKEHLQMYHITDAYILRINGLIEAIVFLSITGENVYLENLTYNTDKAEYSLGTILLYLVIVQLIQAGYKAIFLLGGNLEYKKRFGGTCVLTYSTLAPKYIPWVETITDTIIFLPQFCISPVRRIITFFIPFVATKKIFKTVLKRKLASEDYKLEKMGLDFNRYELHEDSGLSSLEFCNHSPTSSSVLQDIFKHLAKKDIKNATLIDFGSGVGRVLFAFHKKVQFVIGVEIEQRWVEIAEKNFAQCGMTNYTLYTSDIQEFDSRILDVCTIFFFYNPFQGRIMESCLTHICDSLKRVPRNGYVIYVNAQCANMFEVEGSPFTCEVEIPYSEWSTKIYTFGRKH